MTNTRNTPAEALQVDVPLRLVRYEIRRGSGGSGRHRGGDGVVRACEALEDGISCTLMTERRSAGPPGRAGGGPGLAGKNTLIRDGVPSELSARAHLSLIMGDVVQIETPGGGGWGE
jgi:N-methylhydantoinase B